MTQIFFAFFAALLAARFIEVLFTAAVRWAYAHYLHYQKLRAERLFNKSSEL